MNKKVINIFNKAIKDIVPTIIDYVCEELSEYDNVDEDMVRGHIEEYSNYYRCEEFFLEGFDNIAIQDGIDIEEEDSVAYVWDNYEEEINSILDKITNQTYDKLKESQKSI